MLLRSLEKGCAPELVMKLVGILQTTVNRRLISGEAIDVEFPMRPPESIRQEEVMKMISGKTSCLLQFAAQCGGAIALNSADFSAEPLAALGCYAENLGIAFQLRDDYLGLFGDVKNSASPSVPIFRRASRLCSTWKQCTVFPRQARNASEN